MLILLAGTLVLQQLEPLSGKETGGSKLTQKDRGLGILAVLYALFWMMIWVVTGPEPAGEGGPYHQVFYKEPQPHIILWANSIFFLCLLGFVRACFSEWSPRVALASVLHQRLMLLGITLIDIALAVQLATVRGIRKVSAPQIHTPEDRFVVWFAVFFLLMIVLAPPRLAMMRITGKWSLVPYVIGLMILTWRVWILNV